MMSIKLNYDIRQVGVCSGAWQLNRKLNSDILYNIKDSLNHWSTCSGLTSKTLAIICFQTTREIFSSAFGAAGYIF